MADKFKKGVFGIDEYKDMLLKDASLSANVFMPHWQISSTTANGMNGDEMICHLKYIVDGLREVYYRCAVLWNDITGFARLITSVCTMLMILHRLRLRLLWCLSVISWRSVFWWRKLNYLEKTTDLLRVTDKLHHIMLYRVCFA